MNLRKDSSFWLYVHLKVGKFFQEICLGPLSRGWGPTGPKSKSYCAAVKRSASFLIAAETKIHGKTNIGQGRVCFVPQFEGSTHCRGEGVEAGG